MSQKLEPRRFRPEQERREPVERVPTTVYFWISRLGGLAGVVCMIIAAVTGVQEKALVASPRTYVLIAIASFLFAIWAVLYELRDQGIKTR